MGGLFIFLYQIRNLLVFILLEVLCGYIIIYNNTYQGIVWLHSSNAVVAEVMETNNAVYNYFDLANQNDKLARENAILRQIVDKRELQLASLIADTLSSNLLDTLGGNKMGQFKYLVARAINNSVSNRNNFITIDKGYLDGVKPNMGIVSPTGIVGKVLLCSEHFSTINSVLHSKFSPAVSIKGTNASGSLSWKGNDPNIINLINIPRHLKPKMGDTVLTSNTSDIFPANLPVGIIKRVSINDNSAFYDIELDLSTDFSTISYVYLIDNHLQREKSELEVQTKDKFDIEGNKSK